jgi:chromosome partitioning protein
MPTRIFTIANQKGGVGKTTTAINLSVALANKGIPTLLIDMDPQANATSGMGLEKTPGGSVYGPLHGDGAAVDKVIETRVKRLSMIPSEVDLAAIEIELGQQKDYLVKLRQVIAPIRESGKFSAIVMDCPPALGMISMNGLACADYLLVALQCEYLAMEGLGQILSVVEQLKEAGVNPSISVGGILMTMFDVRTNLSRQVVSEVNTHFPDLIFKSIIPRSVRLSEAPSFGQNIFEYDKNSSGAIAYENLGKEIIKRFSLKKKVNPTIAKPETVPESIPVREAQFKAS